MSRPAHRARARAQRDEALAAEHTRTVRQRRLRRATGTALSLAAFGVITAKIVSSSHHTSALTFLVAGGIAGVIVGGFWAHRALGKRIGRITAILALGLVVGVVFLAIAALAPDCPGNSLPGRCTSGDLGNWATAGLLLPPVYAVLIGLPLVTVGFVWRALRVIWGLTNGDRHIAATLRSLKDRRRSGSATDSASPAGPGRP